MGGKNIWALQRGEKCRERQIRGCSKGEDLSGSMYSGNQEQERDDEGKERKGTKR